MRPFTGPGYFVAYPWPRANLSSGAEGAGVLIDYRKLPPKPPPGWPSVRNNRGGIARLVYGESDDLLRRVGAYVTVGRMRKGGAFADTWFALVREPQATPS
jgi:hypothetical protein